MWSFLYWLVSCAEIPFIIILYPISLSLSLSLSLSTFHLLLWPSSDVFSPNVQFNVHQENGDIKPSNYDPSTFYKGIIKGINESLFDEGGSLEATMRNDDFVC